MNTVRTDSRVDIGKEIYQGLVSKDPCQAEMGTPQVSQEKEVWI